MTVAAQVALPLHDPILASAVTNFLNSVRKLCASSLPLKGKTTWLTDGWKPKLRIWFSGDATVYRGPGTVGKSSPTMTAAIQTITATPSDFSHPI